MDIKKYTSFFHDCSILAIQHQGNNLVISMESAEMNEEDKLDDVVFSKEDSILGKLHLEGVKSILDKHLGRITKLEMKNEHAGICHFEFNESHVEFQIRWESFPFNRFDEDFSVVKIEAEKIWWENCPDMPDP